MSQMTPREIVEELDKHIVGQGAAKRAVAIALRNRWRRRPGGCGPASRDHPEEHPDDRTHGRRKDRDRPAPGAPGEGPVHQGGGHEIHRSRLCRPRSRLDRPRSCRDLSENDPRARKSPRCAIVRARRRRGPRAGHPVAARPSGLRRGQPAARQRHPATLSKNAARGRARRAGDRDRSPRHAGRRGDHGSPRHGGNDSSSCSRHVPEPGRRQPHAHAQAEDQGGAQASSGRGSGQDDQRGGAQGPRGRECRAKRHRVHRRDRQDCASPGDRRRGRVA